VDEDSQYRALARSIWEEGFVVYPEDPTTEQRLKTEKQQVERAVKALAQLRAHGARVLFVRFPSDGPYLETEERLYPRTRSWDGLLAETHAPGIYFADYPQLRGYYLPEWSHLTRAEAEQFTTALYQIIQQDFWGLQAAEPASGGLTAVKP
jgi:hypothetical protein